MTKKHADENTMPEKQPKAKHESAVAKDQQIAELTSDLQRLRADFENYRKRSDTEKAQAKAAGAAATILKLLPVIDTIDRAVTYMPAELQNNKWAQGVVSTKKNVDKLMASLNVVKIDAVAGSTFDPELHEAVQFDEEAVGDTEIIAEELQSGYMLGDVVIRHAMVKVTKQ
jgi:molecular chaperone GrpE